MNESNAKGRSCCKLALCVLISLPAYSGTRPSDVIQLQKFPGSLPAENEFKIEVVEGENQVHYVGEKNFSGAIRVSVSDELDRPVPLASVAFYIEPSASSAGAETRKGEESTYTRENGIARLDLRANRYEGAYNIVAHVEFHGKVANKTIHQENRKQRLVKRKSTWIVAGVAAAIIVAVVVADRPTPTATIATVTPSGPVTQP